jgi:hypothetical protein
LRVWVEFGFRMLKSVGWRWPRSDAERIARHRLVLAITMLWTVAVGTRVEEADQRGSAPTHLHQPTPPSLPHDRPRRVSLVAAGRSWLVRQLVHGRLWTRLWLTPELWPEPPTD